MLERRRILGMVCGGKEEGGKGGRWGRVGGAKATEEFFSENIKLAGPGR